MASVDDGQSVLFCGSPPRRTAKIVAGSHSHRKGNFVVPQDGAIRQTGFVRDDQLLFVISFQETCFKKHAIRPVPAAAPNDSRKHLCDMPLHGMPWIAVRHMNCMDVTCQVTSMGIDYFSTSQ
jgi:hypothetical protein